MASRKTSHCLTGIICVLSTICMAGCLEMYTIPKILTPCGRPVTLTCNIVSKVDLNIKQLFWMEKKELCDYTKEIQNGTDFECKRLSYKNGDQRIYNYSLTFSNIQPKHKGTYHCKLRAAEGVLNDKTIVRVQKCVGNVSTDVTPDEGTCTFKDVFPEPIIRWNQDYDNLTHLSKTTITESVEGLFTAVSTLKLKKDSSNRAWYNCSLFMSVENEKNETEVQWMRSLAFPPNGGHELTGHWFGVMLAMVWRLLLT
ncbi:hypothetical protein WMY93_003011 [Mugilogobius chulae]|uniref:Ig-like domain-containing protein n=1 Tax=Mugilogobius chulae TaxID=88201 RepID=A0AAW0PW90_9GOBI